MATSCVMIAEKSWKNWNVRVSASIEVGFSAAITLMDLMRGEIPETTILTKMY